MDAFNAIDSLSDSKQKEDKYNELLNEIDSRRDANEIYQFIQHLLSDSVPLMVSRKVLANFAKKLPDLPSEMHKEIARFTLDKIQQRIFSFGEQAAEIRENLASLLEEEEQWSESARVLSGIDMESGQSHPSNDVKLARYIKIAMLYLEDADHGNAEVFIKRAASLIANCEDDALQLQYKFCYARILDAKRRFLEVAMRYYELSLLGKMEVGGKKIKKDELEMALLASVQCTILAAPCPQRSRMLATLYKDELTARLPVYSFLEKVFMERILKKEEVERFASTLAPHQLARLPDGTTVLDNAVLQHNILSASKLYVNIAIDQLATLLGVTADKAESVAAEMIAEGRVNGHIDQVDGFVYFSDSRDDPLRRWDSRIRRVCQSVNRVADMMEKKGISVQTDVAAPSSSGA